MSVLAYKGLKMTAENLVYWLSILYSILTSKNLHILYKRVTLDVCNKHSTDWYTNTIPINMTDRQNENTHYRTHIPANTCKTACLQHLQFFFCKMTLALKKTNISVFPIQHSNKLIKCHLEKLPLVFSCKHVRCFLTQMFANMTLTMPLGLLIENAEGAEGLVFTHMTRPVNI